MTDPADALASFQQAFLREDITLERCELDPDLHLLLDRPNGEIRLTYARLEGRTVKAIVLFVAAEPYQGKQCFGIGYAVPEAYRGRGLAKQTIEAAIAELANGLGKIALASFFIEAIVGKDNPASQRVAEQTISSSPKPTTDAVSGQPAFHYMRKIDARI